VGAVEQHRRALAGQMFRWSTGEAEA